MFNIYKALGKLNRCRYNFSTVNSGFLLYREWISHFEKAKIEEPEFSLKCILAHVLGEKYNGDEKYLEKELTSEQNDKFQQLCHCRASRMPLQYVVGEWDFLDLTLKMTPPVFIPRPETEKLVEIILDYTKKDKPLTFLEIGCGTGAISLSLLKGLPSSSCIAVDRSKLACQLTAENSKMLELDNRITVIEHKVSSEQLLPEKITKNLDIIVSNPPYIRTGELQDLPLEITIYESITAINGGNDGLKVVRDILQISSHYLKYQGKLYLELDSSHPEIVKNLIKTEYPALDFLKTHVDMFGKPRFVSIIKN